MVQQCSPGVRTALNCGELDEVEFKARAYDADRQLVACGWTGADDSFDNSDCP